ncbi:hypothetical protein BD770DRAFT_395826 [Pilaira anomala]|nr:hypothetical protein BD770DRAFT_395826 [Pilaira anomala]
MLKSSRYRLVLLYYNWVQSLISNVFYLICIIVVFFISIFFYEQIFLIKTIHIVVGLTLLQPLINKFES